MIRAIFATALLAIAFVSPAMAQFAPRNIATGQVSCGTGATALVPINMNRAAITIENTTATPIYLGVSTVSAVTGHLLPGVIGASITLSTSAAIFCIAGSAATVTFIEAFF